jgi:hypothetical protein
MDESLKPTTLTTLQSFEKVTEDLRHPPIRSSEVPFKRFWSYGDVENNEVYYHPQLTHYAHQFFEEVFHQKTGLHYVDLSRDADDSKQKRHTKNVERMTLPVLWLHQFMLQPMRAGQEFETYITVMSLDYQKVAVRAWSYIHTPDGRDLAAVVIWIRKALLLPERKPIPIPEWFIHDLVD